MGGIANLSQCGGINQMDIPPNKQGEGGFVAVSVSLEQRDVFRVRHLLNYVSRTEIVTGILEFYVAGKCVEITVQPEQKDSRGEWDFDRLALRLRG